MDHVNNQQGLAGFGAYLDERPGDGVRRLDRGLYTDPELFALEVERIFEGAGCTWRTTASCRIRAISSP